MKTLFDISYYTIYCLREDGTRPAGMSRYVEEFSQEMVSRPHVDARFVTLHSPLGELQSLPYARSSTSFLKNRVTRAWMAPSKDGPPNPREELVEKARISGTFDIFHALTHMYGVPDSERLQARARFVTIHDLIPVLFPEYLSRGTVRSNFERLLKSIDVRKDWIICISESTKRDFCDYTSMGPERVFVIPEAASRRLFFPVRDKGRIVDTLRRIGVPDGDYILSVCLQEPKKNLPHLIRCFYRFIEEREVDTLTLVLVGAKGWGYDEITSAVDGDAGLRNRIVFTGPLSDEDLGVVYSEALFFVFTSLYEGFGLPALEAMQCGVPVITSAVSSLPELVDTAGILVDPGNERELCDAMDRLWRSPSDRAELRRRGLKRATDFSWEQTVDRTLAAYRTALENPS